MIKENHPALTDAYNRGMQKEAEKKAQKKPVQKETTASGVEKKSV